MKNGFPAPNKELALNQKQLLDRKSPIQVRIHLPPAKSHANHRFLGVWCAGVYDASERPGRRPGGSVPLDCVMFGGSRRALGPCTRTRSPALSGFGAHEPIPRRSTNAQDYPYPPLAIVLGIGSVRKLSLVPSVDGKPRSARSGSPYKTSDRSARRIGDGRCLRGTRVSEIL